ncbi:5-formyltetrahydrofolate cyclo-ligase [Marinicrinis lubricantis]|uniref:5-formyltetrahydrofolate cyclo-ligase n=1 Tax=Marinicrinis lubricantis TaxID=2086470 RepID=A0ABW1IRF7_9BACL
MNEQIAVRKNQLRKQLQETIGQLDNSRRERFSREICRHLIEFTSQLGESGLHLFMYWPYRQEVNLIPYMEWAWSRNHIVLLPRTEPQTLEMMLHAVSSENQLVPGPWGLREPSPNLAEWTSLDRLNLILFPGLGFDHAGRRLGYGKGFYDRWWDKYVSYCKERGKKPNAISVAAAFRCQIVDEVPSEKHDTRVSHLWTELGQLF